MQRDNNAKFETALSVLSVPDLGPPQNLPPLLPEVPDLPIDMMPSSLQPWLEDTAERSQIPLAFIAAPAIVALSSLIGRNAGIHPKQKDDWLVVPNLWGAVIGRPGVLKSPAVAEAFKPIQRLAAFARETFEEQSASLDAQDTILKVQLDAAKDAAKKAAKKNDSDALAKAQQDLIDLNKEMEEAEVNERRYIVNDGTVEKLGELLKDNPRGLLLARDEISGWLRTLDKPGREGDREFYLEAWNGSGAYTYDRIGRGTLHIPALCLSICGTIQPGKLQSYLSGAMKGGAGDDGLLQRLQLLVWPEISPNWVNVDRAPNQDARYQAYEVFQAIDTLSAENIGATSLHGDIPALRFTHDAQELFDAYRNELELRLRSNEFGSAPAFESHLSKYRSLMPSLALVYHIAEVVNGSASGCVSIDAARQAARWCEFLEAHARKLYAAELNTDLSAAHAISEKIRSGAIEDGQRVRDIYRPQWSGLTIADRVWSGLRVLESHNHLKIEETDTAGRPTDILRINPNLKRIAA